MRRIRQLQQRPKLGRRRAQRNVVIEPRHVLGSLLRRRDTRSRRNGRDLERSEGARRQDGQGAACVREDNVHVGARAHGARHDEVDGCARRVLREVDDGLWEETANETGLDVRVGRVHVHERLVSLQTLPYGPERRVAGELAAVLRVDAHAAAEPLLGVEKVEFGKDAVDVVEAREDPKEAESARVFLVRGQIAQVYVEIAGEFSTFFTRAGYWDAWR